MSAVEQASTGAAVQAEPERFLSRERATLREYSPDLADFLEEADLLEIEKPGSEAIKAFRESGAPALLAPADRGGLGASTVECVRFQRAIGSKAPSLSVAATMHHFSMGSLVEWCRAGGETEWALLEGIASRRMLLASGFAEGKTGQSIVEPTLRATPSDNGYLLNGAKKPCSLAWSMDLLTASVLIEPPDGSAERGIAVVPADVPNLEREPFWRSNILAGAESDAVVLRDVEVSSQLVFPEAADVDRSQANRAFMWFELLISASYLGIGSALVERLLGTKKGSPAVRTQLAVELEPSMCALEYMARLMEEEAPTTELLNRLMLVRYSTQQAIARCATRALEALGGVAFISSSEVA